MDINEIIQDRYQLEKVLGQGGMGITYKALDLTTQHHVAVKVLHLSRMKEWKKLEMFEREARVLQQLRHPRIPAYIDYSTTETASDVQFILVQEYIEGKTLQQLVEEGWHASEAEILDILTQLTGILEYLHGLTPPVIHRDINPKNIILSPDNNVYLVDFGAVQERIRTTLHGSSTIVGTFGYIPFEQFSGQTVPASDYYAAGATLLYLISHRHPDDFPKERLKIQFQSYVQASPLLIRLLEGLLESSIEERIASSKQIKAILEAPKIPPAAVRKKIPKPPGTRIEKFVEDDYHISFRIPKKIIGVFTSPTVLELTPEHVAFHDTYGIGNSWTVPTNALQASDVTWHFKNNTPLLGVNYHGETLLVSSQLTSTDIAWLIQEITEYLSTVYISRLPEEVRATLKNQPEKPFMQPIPLSKPAHTAIEKVIEGHDHIRFSISARGTDMMKVAKSAVIVGALSFPALGFLASLAVLPFLIWEGAVMIFAHSHVFRLFGKRKIDITPAYIQVSNECFGISIGSPQRIPTTALQLSDINWYFGRISLKKKKKKKKSPGKLKPRPMLGINYEGNTVEIPLELTQEEIKWLVQEIRDYTSNFAKPL